MRRRQVLRLSGLALTVPFAGCTSVVGTEEKSEFTVTKTSGIPVKKRISEFARSYPGQAPFTEVVLGEKSKTADNSHGVEIYNDCENPVEISLTVNRGSDEGTLVFEGEGTILNGEYLVIVISDPTTYIHKLETSGEGVNLQKTFDVPQSAWNTAPKENKGISPEHNIHINKGKIDVRFVGEER
ncbi:MULTISPECIES: hypothetical protein [Halorussus]|uniref:Uncharacterized protein n=2 Tax=Halorussus TaxID=1070314 RepID=A0A8U0I1W6_9EURY|nr:MULTISPECIES: hypothetical protein [Halorussus]UPV77179.1 hypothetical protein M0R89_22665 [Halorussus limi]